jgi:hypothetical protein
VLTHACGIGLEFEDGNNETVFIAHTYASFLPVYDLL